LLYALHKSIKLTTHSIIKTFKGGYWSNHLNLRTDTFLSFYSTGKGKPNESMFLVSQIDTFPADDIGAELS